ncbi:helix-turn-helix transcriptional regulator [Laribacter hongkongensis]|uniref:LexA family transcriptional regulator n=1 Tax=Laribacter hongkongensis TaxID=168471 RepID=UPI001EFD1C22|nr:helix-turn-helix transcriptional regulator [Laribacter hongkongensis]MCG8993251.1 helix-turn-helix transcriptional regulator [Laribacter hongkongensis]MCG8997930.1 helix-turn-helix transcriptional regulator [Laribacter hongkongensis]MCG9002359.1 helix-turn-helix transcriptional regulator [Laribacter hongkongensis]MCG9005669.1 helix-turn-helix transcriptional regulator [Laribacter hongkongensis]MCG9008806.1 helix-turn-helix transcriptional regulator [Laribacter hongkongensis]
MSKSETNQRSSASLPILCTGIGNRIALVADSYGTRTEAAAAAGVSVISLRRYITEEQSPPFLVLANLAIPKGISLEWLATGEGAMKKGADAAEVAIGLRAADSCGCLDTLGNPVDLGEFVFIPRYNLQAAAGYGASTDGEKPVFSMAFRKYWIDNYLRADPHNLSVISVTGDSMEGVLNQRDVILVNHAECNPGAGLFVVRMDGDLIVKRVQRLPGNKLEVSSANEAYKPFEVDMNNLPEDFEIIGRVVWFGRQI